MPIEHINESEQANGLNLHRRTVLKGAAWAAPVVAAAVAVPMAAASVDSADFNGGTAIGVGGSLPIRSENLGNPPLPTNIYGNVWSSEGHFLLETSTPQPDATTGTIFVSVSVPYDSTAGSFYATYPSNGANVNPAQTGPALGNSGALVAADGSQWTYVWDDDEGAYIFQNSGITLSGSETSGSVVFPPLLFEGEGAYYRANNTRNNLQVVVSTSRGWSFSGAFFPSNRN